MTHETSLSHLLPPPITDPSINNTTKICCLGNLKSFLFAARDRLVAAGRAPPGYVPPAANADNADNAGADADDYDYDERFGGGDGEGVQRARRGRAGGGAGPPGLTVSEVLAQSDTYELRYFVFDILFMNDGSCMDRPLAERHALLRSALVEVPAGAPGTLLTPPAAGGARLEGRLAAVLPGTPWSHPLPPGPPAEVARRVEGLLGEAMARDEEGLVLKALHSPWARGDRSAAWIKVKPDYEATEDLDLLVIGAYRGTGSHRGGHLSEFLLGIAQAPPTPGEPPTSFVSFCRVGSGLSNGQLENVRAKLARAGLQPADRARPRGGPPACYRVTGSPDELPDAWVADPFASVVLCVKADVRLVASSTFAAAASLRFPRATAVRWDKDAACVMTTAQLAAMVEETGGKLRMLRKQQPGGEAAAPGRRGAGAGRGGARPPAPAPGARGFAPARPVVGGGAAAAAAGAAAATPASAALRGHSVALFKVSGAAALAAAVARAGGRATANVVSGNTLVVLQAAGAFDPARYASHAEALRAPGADVVGLEWLQGAAREGAHLQKNTGFRVYIYNEVISSPHSFLPPPTPPHPLRRRAVVRRVDRPGAEARGDAGADGGGGRRARRAR